MKDQVIQYLNEVHPLSNALKAELRTLLKEMQLESKAIYLREGEICKRISFIGQGLMRSYHVNREGAEVTNWFMKEGDITISVKSFFEQIPGKEFIAAIEPTVLWYINYDELQHLFNKYPEFSVVGRMLTEKYYALCEERLMGIRSLSAKKRYQFLLQLRPEIVQRCPDKYIASYLDISVGTLARQKAQW